MTTMHTEILDLLNEAKSWAEMKREAEKEYKARAERLKAYMKANGLSEVVTPEGAKAKLSTSNRTASDRKVAETILDAETFTRIFTVKPCDTLKVS